MKQAQQKLEICQRELTQWSSKKFGRLEATLQAKKKLLAVLQKNENLTNLAKIKKKKKKSKRRLSYSLNKKIEGGNKEQSNTGMLKGIGIQSFFMHGLATEGK